MPVAGLPAALETLLSSLLATEEPSSWKVDGGQGHVVVVMRFRQRDADRPPLHSEDWRMGWRKKTPAMRRRDRQRAEEHHQKSKQKPTVIFSETPSRVATHEVVCDSQSHVPTQYVTPPSVTSDPMNTKHIQVGTAPASSDEIAAPEESAPKVDTHGTHGAQAPPSGTEAALGEMRGFIRDVMEQKEQKAAALIQKFTDVCAAVSSVPLPPPPSGTSLRRGVPCRTAHGGTGVLSALGAPRAPRATGSATCSGSAVSHHSGSPPVSRAPPTHQQPARAARRT